MSDERRKAKRTRFQADVELDDLLRATISNLSADGAFIDSRMVLAPGTTVQLRFTVHDREIQTAAEVRFSAPGIGMGVKFLDLDPGVRAEIEQLLAQGEIIEGRL
jgi:hypothetical protein